MMIMDMKEKPVGFYVPYIQEKNAIKISVSQAHVQRKGKSPKYLYGDEKKVESYISFFYDFNLFGKVEIF